MRTIHLFPFGRLSVITAITACMSLMLCSCEEHSVAMDSTKSVGNVLLANNEIISPLSYDPNIHDAVGVIFLVREDTAFVVSSREEGSLSFSDDAASVDGISHSPYDFAGFENSVAIMASAIQSDAVEHIAMNGMGWYLPAAGELKALAFSLYTVENSMRTIGGDGFANDLYLSSTEDGSSTDSKDLYCLCVNIRNGYMASSPKSQRHRTRAVMRFK